MFCYFCDCCCFSVVFLLLVCTVLLLCACLFLMSFVEGVYCVLAVCWFYYFTDVDENTDDGVDLSITIIHVAFSPFHRQYYTLQSLKHVLFFLFQRNESFKVSRGV